jgi:hypothetical protein
MGVPSETASTATAWSRVRDFDGRPALPLGVSQSKLTLRFTLSRAWARVMDRRRIEWMACPVVDNDHAWIASGRRGRLRCRIRPYGSIKAAPLPGTGASQSPRIAPPYTWPVNGTTSEDAGSGEPSHPRVLAFRAGHMRKRVIPTFTDRIPLRPVANRLSGVAGPSLRKMP